MSTVFSTAARRRGDTGFEQEDLPSRAATEIQSGRGPFGQPAERQQSDLTKTALNAGAERDRAAAEREAADERAAEALRVRQVETRGQGLARRAAAAGATRSGNEQDLLAEKSTKRRYASRTLLGE